MGERHAILRMGINLVLFLGYPSLTNGQHSMAFTYWFNMDNVYQFHYSAMTVNSFNNHQQQLLECPDLSISSFFTRRRALLNTKVNQLSLYMRDIVEAHDVSIVILVPRTGNYFTPIRVRYGQCDSVIWSHFLSLNDSSLS